MKTEITLLIRDAENDTVREATGTENLGGCTGISF